MCRVREVSQFISLLAITQLHEGQDCTTAIRCTTHSALLRSEKPP
jgi:hypothetical protein